MSTSSSRIPMFNPAQRRPPEEPASAAPGTIAVEISSTQSVLSCNPDALRALVVRTLRGEGIHSASISLALVDNRTIHGVNREYLQHDWPTDVISFPLSEPDDPELAGELVVSAEMAQTTAHEIGADSWDELALYVVHGLLHLCGYDDGAPDEAAAMRAREDLVLRREGLRNTFPLAVRKAAPAAGREAGACSD